MSESSVVWPRAACRAHARHRLSFRLVLPTACASYPRPPNLRHARQPHTHLATLKPQARPFVRSATSTIPNPFDSPSSNSHLSLPALILPLGFTLDTLLFATPFLALSIGFPALRRARRRHRGLCPTYAPTTAATTPPLVCPECGADNSPRIGTKVSPPPSCLSGEAEGLIAHSRGSSSRSGAATPGRQPTIP